MSLRAMAGLVLGGAIALLPMGARAGDDPKGKAPAAGAEATGAVAGLDDEPPPVDEDGEPVAPRRRHIKVLENPADISTFYRAEDSEPYGGFTYTGGHPGEAPGLALSRMYGGGRRGSHGWGWSGRWVGRVCPIHRVRHTVVEEPVPVPMGRSRER